MSDYTDEQGHHSLFGSGGGRALSENLGVPLLASIPLGQSLREGGDAGVPVVVSHPESPVSVAFSDLADAILALKAPRIYRDELKVV